MSCSYEDVLHPCETTLGFFFPPLQPSKLSENLVQQFLVPDKTPSILEAEMALRADVVLKERKTSSPRQMLSPDSNQKDDFRIGTPEASDHKQENDSKLSKYPEVSTEKENLKEQAKAQVDVKKVKEDKIREVRQEPEGQLADSTQTEEPKKPVVGCVQTTHMNFVSKLAMKHCNELRQLRLYNISMICK